jgi:hypothetical protein
MENNRLDFKRYQKVLYGWHHVLDSVKGKTNGFKL